jgi:hypothetical protein
VIFSEDIHIMTVKGFCLGFLEACGEVCHRAAFTSTLTAKEVAVIEVAFFLQVLIAWRGFITCYIKESYRMEKNLSRILFANYREGESEGSKTVYIASVLCKICTEVERSPGRLYILLCDDKLMEALIHPRFIIDTSIKGRRPIVIRPNLQLHTPSESSPTKDDLSNVMFGLGPYTAQPGDMACILLGCPVPVIIRQEGDHYIFIGEAFVACDEVMNGELFEKLDKTKVQSFKLH